MSVIAVRLRARVSARQRARNARAGEVSLCPACIEHFGVGYGPLERGRLSAVVRFHRKHG